MRVDNIREQAEHGGSISPFVEGELIESVSARSIPVVSPINGQTLLMMGEGSTADVEAAVASARRAADERRWRDLAPSLRKALLIGIADRIVAEARAIDALDAVEMGKPVSIAFGNANAAAAIFRFAAECSDKVTGDVYVSDRKSYVTQRRVPHGVVGAVVPWNFPAYTAALKVAPALAAGNCVVLKPSEMSSRSAIRIAQIAIEAGLPAGVLNVVPGIGPTVGQALARHHDVDMLTFTGSTPVGKLMLEYAAQSNMKPVMAECGGKSPQIVFADGVDLPLAAKAVAQLLLVNQGQVCVTGSRLLVERGIEQSFVEAIRAEFQRIQVGDPLDPKTVFGPLASATQCERVMAHIAEAHREGAQLVTGGRRALEDSGGYFVEPTLFRNVAPTSRMTQEEIFGPVLSVTAFDSEEEAIRLANGTMYALSAYIWTADMSRAMRMANEIRSAVRLNAAPPSGEGPGYAYSWEPAQQSGVGVEGGMAGLESYLRRQLVWINHA